MNFKKIVNISKAAIIHIIVAFLFVIIICFIVENIFGEKINVAINIISMITVTDTKNEEITPVLENGALTSYPVYGSQYATLKIPSIDVELPIFYGASYSILKSGIAQDEASYFPGEGGSIVLAGHNFKNYLAKLPEAKIGDQITIETNYGTFNYVIEKTKIVKETAIDEVPIQNQEEILMIYTCWPINNIGHASERYVVYSKLAND